MSHHHHHTHPQSAAELFDVHMPQALAKAPEKAKEVGSVYVFDIEGEGGGKWTVDLKSDVPAIHKGIGEGAECTIKIANSDFVEMLKNPALGMQMFMTGKLKVTGNPMLAMKLQKLFAL
jgi:alkyl sulfatase BDS1-like metallo-beta-lactamase superfamily hydrolase